MTPSLSVQDLTLFRGDRRLVNALSFELMGGQLVTVEGVNGSGKTTLLRAIAGLIDVEEGKICWNNRNVKRDRQAFHENLVWMGHRPGFKGELTLLENLRFESGLRTMTMPVAERQLARLGLAGLTSIPFRQLSAGQQRRVALARMIMADAPLWLMDEPFTNLDAAGRQLVVEVLGEHAGAGGLCILATHQQLEIDGPMQRIVLS